MPALLFGISRCTYHSPQVSKEERVAAIKRELERMEAAGNADEASAETAMRIAMKSLAIVRNARLLLVSLSRSLARSVLGWWWSRRTFVLSTGPVVAGLNKPGLTGARRLSSSRPRFRARYEVESPVPRPCGDFYSPSNIE